MGSPLLKRVGDWIGGQGRRWGARKGGEGAGIVAGGAKKRYTAWGACTGNRIESDKLAGAEPRLETVA